MGGRRRDRLLGLHPTCDHRVGAPMGGLLRSKARRHGLVTAAIATCVGLMTGVAAPPPGLASPARAADAAAVIAKYQARIPELMAEQNIPGLAVALVDTDHPLWVEGFGHVDGPDSASVTPDTIFKVESMSKLFTATAVMVAVQAGRLGLDVPITTYLPEFTVHSAFEEHAERKITLRMLLSHTAGFTHEAPIGNNNELDPGDFDAHVRSISDTWLRFPVGTGEAYSNLGIDLAGYILERTYGKPFAEVMGDLLLDPLGMDHSTFDRARIRSTTDRALGHAQPFPEDRIPLDEPMTAAGGLYASAADLARFLEFQLGDGTIDGRSVLSPAFMDEQRTVPAPNAGALAGYALGVERTRWRAERYQDIFNHGGGGFGFISDLWWVPTLQLGIAILTNSQDHDLQVNLPLSILADLVDAPGSTYQARLLAQPVQGDVTDLSNFYQAPAGLTERIAAVAMPASADQADRWARYAGGYGHATWGVISPFDSAGRFLVEGGVPYFEAQDDDQAVRHRLTEIEPGLFLSDEGETLDMRSDPPTWKNLELVAASGGPAPWQWALLGLGAFLAIVWLIAAVVRTIRRIRSRRRIATPEAATPGRGPRLAAIAAALTAIAALGTIALMVAMPGLVDSGYIGWLELPLVERLALHLPLALTVLAACMVVLAIASWRGRWWSRGEMLQYGALAAATAVVVVQLAAWRLIGWGMS